MWGSGRNEKKTGKHGRKRAHTGNQRAGRVLEMEYLEGQLVKG